MLYSSSFCVPCIPIENCMLSVVSVTVAVSAFGKSNFLNLYVRFKISLTWQCLSHLEFIFSNRLLAHGDTFFINFLVYLQFLAICQLCCHFSASSLLDAYPAVLGLVLLVITLKVVLLSSESSLIDGIFTTTWSASVITILYAEATLNGIFLWHCARLIHSSGFIKFGYKCAPKIIWDMIQATFF